MQKEIKERSLITSLLSLKNECTHNFDPGRLDEFVGFYKEVLTALQEYSEQKKSRYIQEKLREFPIIRPEDYEDNYFISAITASSILRFFLSGIAALHRQRACKQMQEELNMIAGTCDSIVFMLNNPGLEEMIYKEK